MHIIAHDENSVTNLLFSEVHRHGKLVELLQEISWRHHDRLPFVVGEAELHQQIGLSEFGKPDATVFVTDPDGMRHVVIIEGKLKTYVESAAPPLAGRLFDNRFNSRINNQLALRFRALGCLDSIRTEGFLTELPHEPCSPHAGDRIRRCKKGLTRLLLEEKLLRLAGDGTPMRYDFYLVALTTDTGRLFRDAIPSDHELSPLFFDQRTRSLDDFRNLGSLSWSACQAVLADVDSNFFSPSYTALWSDQTHEPGGLESVCSQAPLLVNRRQMVEYHGEVCLLSCTRRRFSYSLNAWRTGGFVVVDRGEKDRRKYETLANRVRPIGKAPPIDMGSIPEWAEYFERNRTPDTGEQPPRASPEGG